jgi:hypothetical protein
MLTSIGLMELAFLITSLKSLLSSHEPLLISTDVTNCFFSSTPIVSFRKRLVLVFVVPSPPFLLLLQLDPLPHRRKDVPLDPQDVVVLGGVVEREAGGV